MAKEREQNSKKATMLHTIAGRRELPGQKFIFREKAYLERKASADHDPDARTHQLLLCVDLAVMGVEYVIDVQREIERTALLLPDFVSPAQVG